MLHVGVTCAPSSCSKGLWARFSAVDHLLVGLKLRYDQQLAHLLVADGRLCLKRTPVSVISRQFLEDSWRPGVVRVAPRGLRSVVESASGDVEAMSGHREAHAHVLEMLVAGGSHHSIQGSMRKRTASCSMRAVARATPHAPRASL